MIAFLEDQPADARDQIMDLLQRGAVQMSMLLRLDFASQPIYLSNRAVSFTDLNWGYEWGPGSGLLVGLPNANGGDGNLAPFNEYQLGIPSEWIDQKDWAARLVETMRSVADYRGRFSGFYVQIFDPETDHPVGYPSALDVGFMDKMAVSFMPGGAVIKLTTEGFLARKGVPVYGMQTYLDQKRRHPTDEGLQFVTEANKTIVWTDW